MRALVKTEAGAGSLELIDWPDPVARPGWVVIEVAACGICGTDLHLLAGTHRSYPPVVLGHEYAGTVTEVGAGVTQFAVGDRIVVEQHAGACGRCEVCRRGAIHLCEHKRPPGWGIDGAFARYVTAPADLAHLVPDDVPLQPAALCEPTAIVLTGLARSPLVPGERVAVVGPGSLGLLSAFAAEAAGADEVMVIGRPTSQARLDAAERWGFRTAHDPAHAGVEGRYDLVIDTTGAESGIAAAVQLAKRQGRLVSLGLSDAASVAVPWNDAMQRNLTVSFSMSSEYLSWDRALRLLADLGPIVDQLVTTYPLADWETAFDAVRTRSVIKAALIPGE